MITIASSRAGRRIEEIEIHESNLVVVIVSYYYYDYYRLIMIDH